jgi:hypothetical protein
MQLTDGRRPSASVPAGIFLNAASRVAKGVVFFANLVSNRFSRFLFGPPTMPSFDALALQTLIAIALTASAIITIGAVSVVRVVLVPNAPSRARRR